MTKRQFKKSRRCIGATKFARVLVWLRLAVCLLVVGVVGVSYAFNFLSSKTTIAGADKIGELISQAFEIFKKEPATFFSLKMFGSLDKLYWSSMFEGLGLERGMLAKASFIVAGLFVLFFFARVKKSKQRVGAFFMLFLFSAADFAFHVMACGLPAFDKSALMLYIAYAIDLITVIACFRAIICGCFLNRNYQKGMRLERYNLRRIYREQRREQPIEISYMKWN